MKNRKSGLRWMLIQVWIPRWKRLQAEGGEKTYLKRACKRTRYYYALWKCDKFDILKTILSQTGKGK